MKNLKIYLSILFVSLLTSSIFFACSSDENQTHTANSINNENPIKSSTNKPADTRLSLTLDPPLPPPSCCLPNLSAKFICRGSGLSTGGSVDIVNPAGCSVDWSTVSKIELSLSNGSKFYSISDGPTEVTLLPPFTSTNLHLVVYNTACLSESGMGCFATFYYNNGCPTTSKDVISFGPVATSN